MEGAPVGLPPPFSDTRSPPLFADDANADDSSDISDAVAILGEKKILCEQAGDANDDGALDSGMPFSF